MRAAETLPLVEVTSCFTAPTRDPLGADEADDFARTLKALADPARLRLVSMVASYAGQEACVCDLSGPLGLSQPTVSHHLRVLVDAGLLGREKRGVWAYYSLVPGRLEAIASALTTI